MGSGFKDASSIEERDLRKLAMGAEGFFSIVDHFGPLHRDSHRTLVPGRMQRVDDFPSPPNGFLWSQTGLKMDPVWRLCIAPLLCVPALVALAGTSAAGREIAETECAARLARLCSPFRLEILEEIMVQPLSWCYRAVMSLWGPGLEELRRPNVMSLCLSKVPDDVGRALDEGLRLAGIDTRFKAGDVYRLTHEDDLVFVGVKRDGEHEEDDVVDHETAFHLLSEALPFGTYTSFPRCHVERMCRAAQSLLEWRWAHASEQLPSPEGWRWWSNYVVELLLFFQKALDITAGASLETLVLDFSFS